jgi:hypothetical protein
MLTHGQRSLGDLGVIATSWRLTKPMAALMVGLAGTLLAHCAAAETKVLVDSHIGTPPATDSLSGAIVVTGAGEPVTIKSFTANDRCTVEFYSDDQLTLSSYAAAGIDMLVALTDDQGPASIAYAAQNGGTIKKIDLILKSGDRIGIFFPALLPGAEIYGIPFSGSCGNRLISLKADTDAGELDWEFAK